MNEQNTTTTTDGRESKSRSNLLTRTLTATLVALGALASLLLMAPSASAAGTSAPDLKFCMSYSNGTAYAAKAVYLYRFDQPTQKWIHYKSGTTGANGCATWRDVRANTWHYVQGYWTYSVGSAGYYYNGNTQAAWVGNAWDGLYSAGHAYIGGAYRLY